MTYKPTREYNGVVGQPSKDSMGPEALSRDLDKVMKMFNPDATHDNGEKGGIGKGNLNFNFGEDGTGGGGSMAEEIGSKEISELKDPSSPSNPALTVWKQIKAIVLLIVAHFSNTSNPHSVTKTQVGLGNVSNNLQATKAEFDAHTNNKENPHAVTKSQVGLGNVNNTSDMDKPISTAMQAALDGKVDKVTGKGLSTYDYDSTEKDKVTANTLARHSHSNKALLDTYTQSNADLAGAVANRHTHSNKSVLDGIVEVTQTLGNAADKVPSEKAVADAMAAAGMGDMMKAVYDQNNNGIVDNAEKVNGHTVESDVPAGAVFTDTVTPVIDSLDSDSSTSALSAKQGKALADLISTKVNPNVIHNGCFRVNQRGKSGTVTLAAGEYGHDRWKAGSGGCTYTFSTSGGVTTLNISSGSLIQVIEGQDLESGTYVLSWEGTTQGKIGSGSFSASPVTGSVTGGNNLSIEFGTGTLSKVKLEKGTVPTPFIKRPYEEELSLCQRYAIVLPASTAITYAVIAVLTAETETLAVGIIPLPVMMRTTPTLSYLGSSVVGNFYLRNSTNTPATAINLTAYTPNGVKTAVTVASGLTAGQAYELTTRDIGAAILLSTDL